MPSRDSSPLFLRFQLNSEAMLPSQVSHELPSGGSPGYGAKVRFPWNFMTHEPSSDVCEQWPCLFGLCVIAPQIKESGGHTVCQAKPRASEVQHGRPVEL